MKKNFILGSSLFKSKSLIESEAFSKYPLNKYIKITLTHPVSIGMFLFSFIRALLVLRIKQTQGILLHLQKLYPYESKIIESEILATWYWSNAKPHISIPPVTKDMVTKWNRLKQEFLLSGKRPDKGFDISEDESFLLRQLLLLKHSLILHDEFGLCFQALFILLWVI